jgi:hypothetical protein
MPREPTAGCFSQVNANARRAGLLDDAMVLLPFPVFAQHALPIGGARRHLAFCKMKRKWPHHVDHFSQHPLLSFGGRARSPVTL